jgi:hypothetical protein
MRQKGSPIVWVYVIAIWLGVVVVAIFTLVTLVSH